MKKEKEDEEEESEEKDEAIQGAQWWVSRAASRAVGSDVLLASKLERDCLFAQRSEAIRDLSG